MKITRKIKRKIVSVALATVMICTPFAVLAKTMESGELYYDGGQTGTHVYSEIGETDDHEKEWKVMAFVYVGDTKTTSGWNDDYAYASAKRVWYANETSRYDYYEITD